MTEIRERLRKAIAAQQHPRRETPPATGDERIEAAFRPVFEAARELRAELSKVPELAIVAEPGQVRIELYDKRLWFGYAPDSGQFVGSETTSLWMEGGLHEDHFTWPTAETCIKAMIQGCAGYASLAEIIAGYRAG